MKMTFTLPLPDNRPKECFEYLTGYGFIEKVDPVGMTVTYSLEADSLVELVRLVDEVEHEAKCYDYWTNSPLDMFEQAQTQIDTQKIGVLQINAAQVKSLTNLLTKVEQGRSDRITVKERETAYQVKQLLADFTPMVAEALKS